MKNFRKRLACLLLASVGLAVSAQTTINLDSPDGGRKEYVASQEITLEPNYEFTAGLNDFMWGYIDDRMPGQTVYEDLYTAADFNTRTIDETLDVGYTPGQHGVSPTGGASYSIPIQIPSGTNGIVPSVSINYNSQSGNGLLGMGWNLAATSMISRVGKTIYHNGETEAVQMNNSDGFALDGQRFFADIVGTNGQNNATHSFENENYSKVTSYGQSGSGPKWFKVETKNGMTMEFGKSFRSTMPEKGSTVLMWGLTKMYDQYGNYIEYIYKTDDFQLRLHEIRYTGNSVEGVEPYNKIKFHYDDRSDQNFSYIHGTKIRSNYLLSEIELESEGSKFKRYEFSYGSNLHSYLKEVTEFGSSNGKLNSTVFKYGSAGSEYSFVQTSNIGDKFLASGDYNGDGKADILALSMNAAKTKLTKAQIYKNTNGSLNSVAYTHNYSATSVPIENYWGKKIGSVSTRAPSFFADFTGDAFDDLLIAELNPTDPITDYYDVGVLKIAKASATGFSDVNLVNTHGGKFKGTSQRPIIVMDINGDKAADVITFPFYDNALHTFVYEPSRARNPSSIIHNNLTAGFILDADIVMAADFTGDGKQELFVIHDDDLSSTRIYSFDYVSGTSGAVEINLIYNSGIFTKWHDLYPGDFNGDGKIDFLYTSDGNSWAISYSTGNGFDHKLISFDQSPSPYFNGKAIEIADYNGDGLSDIFFPHTQDLSLFLKSSFYISQGDHTFVKKEYTNSFSSSKKVFFSSQILSADFNGDGKANLIHMQNQDLNGTTFPIDIISLKSEGEDLRLAEVKDGFNKNTKFNYSKLTNNNVYSKGSVSSPKIMNIQQGMSVVKDVSFSNGTGGVNTIEYKYESAVMDRIGQGVFGFLRMTTVDLASNRRAEQTSILTMNNGKYSILPRKLEELRDSHDELLSETTTTYRVSQVSGKRFKTEIVNTEEKNAIMGWVSTKNMTYDNFGNVILTISENGVETINSAGVFDVSTGSWLNYLASSISVRKERVGQLPVTQNEALTYNTKGKIASKTLHPTKTKALSISYAYDNFGNLASTVESAANLPSKTQSFSYDNKGRFLKKKTNEFGQDIVFEFHKLWGTATKEIDIRGKVTRHTYNQFGKHIKSITPTGLSTTFSYDWDIGDYTLDPAKPIQFNSSMYSITQNTTNAYSGTIWYDILKREIKVSREHQSSTDVVYFVNYDAIGNGVKTSAPNFAGSSSWIITEKFYDKYNRIKRIDHPSGNVYTTYQISGSLFSTTNGKSGRNKTKTIDVSGKVISATDNGGTLNYEYYSSGFTKSVSSGSTAITEMEYDEYNRQTKLIDVNAGTSEYKYNAYGQLIEETDALNNVRAYTYDNFGRVDTEIGAEGTTSFTYITSGNGINQVKKVTKGSGVNSSFHEYDYDSYGRNTKLEKKIDGVVYSTSFSYNSNGQKTSVTYPSGHKIFYTYTSKSELDEVKDQNNNILFSNATIDHMGNYEQYDLGNGLTQTNDYNQYGMLLKSKAGTIFEMEYSYNVNKENLISRSDNILGLTETFEYDNLDRLLKQTVGTYAPTTGYQPNGNLNHQTDIAYATYDAVKINQEKELASLQTQCRLDNQDVTYTVFDRTATVIENGYELTLNYDAFKNRNKTQLKHLGVIQNTRYFIGNYEKTVTSSSTQEIHYIPCGGGVTILYVVENSTGNYFYPHTDHLGSVLKVTDDIGTVVANQNFDAWGRYRNPTDWTHSNVPTTNPSWLYRGFTGHEMLPMFTLINMNNRMYDPEVGRFLAVDNFVNDPYSSQDYNRYTYANNNPLKFIDQNGESVTVVVLVTVLAIAGAYGGGVATNGGQTDPSMWNWKSGKTWAGIGIGAVVGGAAGLGMASGGAALASTALMGNFGTSGMITSYVIAGAATGGAGGYIIGFTGTTISGGNFSSSHKAGTQYGKIGAAFGSVVGGVYGNSLSIEATLKHEPPRQQEYLVASLDDSYYSSNFSQNFSSNSDDDYEVVKTMYMQSGGSIEFDASSAIKVKVTNLNVTGGVVGGVQDQTFKIQKENWFGGKYWTYNTPVKGFTLFYPSASSEYKFSHFMPSPMHWKINVSMQCDACYLNVIIYQVK